MFVISIHFNLATRTEEEEEKEEHNRPGGGNGGGTYGETIASTKISTAAAAETAVTGVTAAA